MNRMIEERRSVKVLPGPRGRVVVKYSSEVEFTTDEEIHTKARQLTSQLAHMKHHHVALGKDIESAEEELRLLNEILASRRDSI